ncbi:hypothetical protein J4458_00155 [Candidatus Woesearchaeota archaeon]|nr:hypothetical protein [Candidatus Woesearchaeota archaeon]
MLTLNNQKDKKIMYILGLSRQLGTDSNKLMHMMQQHSSEIKQLYNKKNPHFAVETGDLILLAMQLLLLEGYSVNGILDKCYDRFDKKLNSLLKNG